VGFLAKAKKLREQAKDAAEQVKKLTEQMSTQAGDALTGAASKLSQAAGTQPAPPPTAPPAPATGATGSVEYGTPYVPGMLGRPGWREQGLTDPAALLPIRDRDHAGVPHTTKSQILEEPFGMGRRWSSGGRSAALFYQLYPEHRAWEPPGGRAPLSEVPGASAAALTDGRTLVFLSGHGQSVVLEVAGLDDPAPVALARTVAARLEA
jgi:hypothetical protein